LLGFVAEFLDALGNHCSSLIGLADFRKLVEREYSE